MTRPVKRAYRSTTREASAKRTRTVIVREALACFEARGWAGTTVGRVADGAGVSPKTVEALFATKARLLAASVTYAFRGEDEELPLVRREAARAVEQAPDAATMVERHAHHAAAISSRTAAITLVVEAAAPVADAVAALRDELRGNRAFGARWAAGHLLAKPGCRAELSHEDAVRVFTLAISPATWSLLTDDLALDGEGAQAWLAATVGRLVLAR